MSHLHPDQQFEAVKDQVSKAVAEVLEVETKNSKLKVHGVEVQDNRDSSDLRSQKKAIRAGKSWKVPIYADLSLHRRGRDDRRKVLVGHIPKTTDRFGYIVKGNEYQVFNQFRLRPGVYHRKSRDDRLFAEFNLGNREQLTGVEGRRGRNFKMEFEPKRSLFTVQVGTTKIPAYHLLKSAGVSADDMARAWGKRVYANKKGQ